MKKILLREKRACRIARILDAVDSWCGAHRPCQTQASGPRFRLQQAEDRGDGTSSHLLKFKVACPATGFSRLAGV